MICICRADAAYSMHTWDRPTPAATFVGEGKGGEEGEDACRRQCTRKTLHQDKFAGTAHCYGHTEPPTHELSCSIASCGQGFLRVSQPDLKPGF